MNTPVWVLRPVIDVMHDMQLAEHGGAPGLRDEGLLESALARPRHLHSHGEEDLSKLAAAYGFGLVRNHPFIDGNKRTAFLIVYVFLRMNGLRLVAEEADAARVMLDLAAGRMTESDFADWLRGNAAEAGE